MYPGKHSLTPAPPRCGLCLGPGWPSEYEIGPYRKFVLGNGHNGNIDNIAKVFSDSVHMIVTWLKRDNSEMSMAVVFSVISLYLVRTTNHEPHQLANARNTC